MTLAGPPRPNIRAMKPTLERSDQVVAHVVAWHNRHPLAQRITADQVHSVGVVSLPFAVRGARHTAAAEPAAPVALLDAAPVDVAPPAPVPEAPPPVDPSPEAAADPAPESAAATDAPADAAIEAVVEFEPDPAGDAAAAAAPDTAPAPPLPAAPSILDRALDTPPAPPSGLTVSPPDAAEPFVTGLPQRPAELPPRPRPWDPRSWWARMRGQAPFHALFSEDFIAPLRPRQVRDWAARHGVGRRPLEPQAPQRLVVLDAARRRANDDAPEVDLHLITAAIGVGDSRHRLLLAPDGSVLGRRQLNRPRMAAAAASALALLGGLGGGWMWHGGLRGAETLAHHSAPAGSAASAAASAAAHAPAGPASSAVAEAASQPASTAVAHAHEAAPRHAPEAAPAHAPASAPSPAPAAAHASAPAAPHAVADAASAPEAAIAAAAPDVVASAPRSVNPRRGRIDLPPLVPKLAATERHDLRTNSRELRGQPAAGPDIKAWALVTGPLADRRQSERVAAQLHAIALLQPVPMRAELMPAGNGWRAVFWPFPTAQDAEKVRLALADKGLRTEVLEF